jgi:hypothetical protein
MSAITSIETRGMLEAYQAVHSPELRAQLDEENELVEQVSVNMIENAAYLLFSQGYDVDDVISYFTEATTNTIIEDYLNFSEGNLIIESVAVSDAYIEEQFEILNEGILNALRGGVQRVLGAGAGAMKGGGGIRDAAGAMLKSGTRAAKQTLGRAATGAKELVKKIPGRSLASAATKSPLGRLGGKLVPGVGLALGAADAANRLKKGDWGGAALSGLGAAASTFLPPGLGTAAALGTAGLQAGLDAAGLTGDKSKKSEAAKTAPSGTPPSLKAKQDYAKSKGKYFSSSDEKTYKNYNDALAAKNSRRGVKPTPTPTPTPAAPSSSPAPAAPSSAAPSSTPAKSKAAPTKPDDSDAKLTNMQKWAKANPTLAARVKPGQSGYDEISAKRTKPGPNEKQDQTPTQGNPDAKIDTKSVEASKASFKPSAAPANSALAKEEERRKREAEKAGKEAQKQLVKASYEYDAYDLVLEYLLSQGHTDTIEEAHYVMMEMDAETIGSIVEAASDQSDKQIGKGVKTTYKAQNVLDNQHQGRSKGLNRLPADERVAKTKRMRGRLKSRRDDLFGERNQREDSKRAELKKMLGL